MFSLILLVFAFVMTVVAGIIGNPAPPVPWGWRLLCWGLAAYFLADILRVGAPLLR